LRWAQKNPISTSLGFAVAIVVELVSDQSEGTIWRIFMVQDLTGVKKLFVRARGLPMSCAGNMTQDNDGGARL
jgi:hypothetical protein